MNEYGLGAVVFYEIPFNSLSKRDTSPKEWTMGGVFGNGDPSSGTGMTVDELLNGIDVRLVYIPLYACTSFVTGQVMNSFFRRLQSHQEKMDPICIPGGFGFSVCSEGFTLFDHGLGSLSSSIPAASRFATPQSNAGSIYMNVDRECSNPVPLLRPILTKEGNEGARSFRNKTDSSHEIVNVKNTNDADDLDKPQPDVSPRNLQTMPTHGQDEQWELDWVDAELSLGFCHSDTTGHEDNIILQQDEDEEQAEESFVTALESLLSDDCLPIDKFKDVSQARSSPMCSPVSGTVFLKVDASTPTIAPNTTITATILDSRHPVHVNPDLSALSSITNLKSAGSIVTESKCPSSSPKIYSKSTCSPEVQENPNSSFESTGGTFSSFLHPRNSDCTPGFEAQYISQPFAQNLPVFHSIEDIINSKSVNYNYKGFDHFSLGLFARIKSYEEIERNFIHCSIVQYGASEAVYWCQSTAYFIHISIYELSPHITWLATNYCFTFDIFFLARLCLQVYSHLKLLLRDTRYLITRKKSSVGKDHSLKDLICRVLRTRLSIGLLGSAVVFEASSREYRSLNFRSYDARYCNELCFVASRRANSLQLDRNCFGNWWPVYDLVHSAFIGASLYQYFIAWFGEESQIDVIPWSVAFTVVITAFQTFIAHCFFANKIYRSSQKNVYLTAPVVFLALLRLSTSIFL
ncbi:hypothetical protein LENED_006472 [Lentinula edodes]|uniref:Uncharacterized protein n=1 Tax=Lentinula edodes TaxID=5353 RepID=A0A1Q3EBR0_LENED|nr:hypothetical protein LENED_006472 [Lentinula edodes]